MSKSIEELKAAEKKKWPDAAKAGKESAFKKERGEADVVHDAPSCLGQVFTARVALWVLLLGAVLNTVLDLLSNWGEKAACLSGLLR